MSDNGRKRCRKTKLVPRDCAEFNDDDCFLQGPAQKKLLLQKIKRESSDNGANPESSLEFSVKVEVEDIDSLPEENPSDYMKYLFSLSKESQAKSDITSNKSTDSWLKPRSSRQSHDSVSDIDTEVDDKVFVLDTNKVQRMLPLLHKKYPSDRVCVTITRNMWGKLFHEIGAHDFNYSIRDRKLLVVLAEWRSWQLSSRSRETPFCYKCYICTDAWWAYSDFRNHLGIHPDATVKMEILHQECNIIAFEGATPAFKEIYVDGKCFKCAKTFKQHYENKRSVYPDSFYCCVYCNEKLQTCRVVVKHAGVCERNPIRTAAAAQETVQDKMQNYPCKVCDIFFLTKPAQLEHMTVCHSVRSDDPITTNFKTCRLCDRIYYHYCYHVCTKKNIIHTCKYCEAKFQNRHQLELHTNMTKWPVKCTICDTYIDRQCRAAEHYAAHTERFQIMYRCLLCKKVRLFPSQEMARQHRLKTHRRSYSNRPMCDKIITPKIVLEQCQLNTHARLKSTKKIPNKVQNIAETKLNNKLKVKSRTRNLRRSAVKNIEHDAETDEYVDIETYDPETGEKTEELNKYTDNLSKGAEELNKTEKNNIINQITETIDIKPDFVIKEEKISEEEDVKPDLTKLVVTKLIADDLQKNKVEKTPEIEKDSNETEPFQGPAASTPVKDKNAEISKVFKVSQSILEPVEVKTEVEAEPEEYEEDLIILNSSSDSIKQETVDSENSNFNLLNLEPEVILRAGYKKRKVYKCTKCDYSGFHREYKEHINNHCMVHAKGDRKSSKKTELKYKCTKCNKGYPCLKKYTLHFVNHGYVYMTCPQCMLVFDGLTRLLPHLNNHIKNQYIRLQLIRNDAEQGKAYQCKTCKEVVDMTNSFVHWENHLELGAEVGKDDNAAEPNMEARGAYVLERDAMDKILALLQQHNLADNGLPQKVKTCFVCHRNFERQNDCKRHLIEHLLDDAHAKLAETQQLTCQICKDRFSMKADAYKKHMRDHASLPIYQCSMCNKTFSDSSNFTKHKKIHNLKAFICDICNKKFQAKLSLEKHIQMHMNTDPYACQSCERVFYDRSFYTRHVRQHHERQRARHKCVICRDKFDTLRQKWDHMWEVHKQRKEKADCPICKKSYRKAIDVKRHCITSHKIDMSMMSIFEFIRQFKEEEVDEDIGEVKEVANESDDDVLLIEEERETLVIYDDDEVPS